MPCGCTQPVKGARQSNGQPVQLYVYKDTTGKTIIEGTFIQAQAAYIRAGKVGTVDPL